VTEKQGGAGAGQRETAAPPRDTKPIVLGTAGHIDHGKTALVRALTGIDTDRLAVEKERGITTELGFAHLDLDGYRLGFVDVPGHERFIRAMVSGAGGLDLVCLAIAADEGIMPQTREHLDVCELLGVRRGIVALTKADLVDDEWLELVADEVRAGLAGRFVADAPLVPVSARTGAGLDDLRRAIADAVRDLPPRPADGVFRLPLDRVFSLRGFGTVVTGTALGGEVGTGDALVVHRTGQEARVRGVQVHGEAVDRARAGTRCALNLTGIDRDDLRRGDWLFHPQTVRPTHLLDARLRYLPTSRGALPRRSKVLLHHGTTQVNATVVLLGADRLEPGADGLVQLRIDVADALAALPGDRFIARGTTVQKHYGTTLGGGEIVRVHAPKVRRSAVDGLATARAVAAADPRERLALEIKASSAAPISTAELERRLGWPSARLAELLDDLVAAGDVVRYGVDNDPLYCHAEPFARLEKHVLSTLDERSRQHDSGVGALRAELRSLLPPAAASRLFETLLAALERRRAIETDGELVRRRRRGPGQSAPAAQVLTPLAQSLAPAFAEWGLAPKRPKELSADVGADAGELKKALAQLVDAGLLVRVKADLLVDADAVAELQQRLVEFLDTHGQIAPPEWKQLAGVSRKFAIPLAEYFDQKKVTLRVGDLRKKR